MRFAYGPRLLTLLLGCALTLSAHAQFNGPADTAKDTVNAPHPITTDLSILYPARHDTILHGGDQVRLSIYGISDYNFTGRITEEGYLTVPLIAPVQVDGLTIREGQALIAQRLDAAQMFHNPPVQIEVTESTKSVITVLGEARGSVNAISGSRRLFDVLVLAGGLPPTASHLVSIDRPGLAESINVDLGTDPEKSKYANVPVYPGDTITTSRIGSVYLIGAWRNAGVMALQNNAPFTMLQAYAQAQGKFFEAKLNEVHLIRTSGTTRTLTIVRLDDVLKGRAPDPVLQADDIIYLPSNKVLAAIRGGGVNTALSFALTAFALARY